MALIFFFTSLFSSGQWDLSLEGVGRITPAALQFDATTGYGFKIWDQGEEDSPFYGYVRPWVSARGPSTLTGVTAVDIYPISFFGVTLGRMYARRLVEQPEINCDRYECLGWLNQTFLRVQGFAKLGPVYARLFFEKTDFDEHSSLSRPVFQSSNGVIIPATGDRGDDWVLTLGYDLNPIWSAGVIGEEFRTEISDNDQNMQVGFVRWVKGDYSAVVGAGRFYSSALGTNFTGVATVTWTPHRRLGY